jgi:hypothetical protein
LTGEKITPLQSLYEEKMLYKGNVLQHIGNRATLTKKQKYSKIANGTGAIRTKYFSTHPSGMLRTGDTLVCKKYTICNSSSCSDVPGKPVNLCWNPSIRPWIPKPRYFMRAGSEKWPQGYKWFVSAIYNPVPPIVRPEPPIIKLNTNVLTWNKVESTTLPTTNYNIYIDGELRVYVSSDVNTYTLNNYGDQYIIYVKTVSGTIESLPSNSVYYSIYVPL